MCVRTLIPPSRGQFPIKCKWTPLPPQKNDHIIFFTPKPQLNEKKQKKKNFFFYIIKFFFGTQKNFQKIFENFFFRKFLFLMMFSYGKSKNNGCFISWRFLIFALVFELLREKNRKNGTQKNFTGCTAFLCAAARVQPRSLRSLGWGGGLGSQHTSTACYIDIHRCTAYQDIKLAKKNKFGRKFF